MKHYDSRDLNEAADDLMNHRILLLPTDTVYGTGVIYGDLQDLEAIRNIKHRPETKPIPFMVSSISMLRQIADPDETAIQIAKKFLPGPLTLILPRKESVDPAFTNGMETIAVRIPDEPVLLELIEKIGKPLLVSSANVSGEPAALSVEEAEKALPNAWGILEGECENRQASTILDCTSENLTVLREGPLSLEEIRAGIEQL